MCVTLIHPHTRRLTSGCRSTSGTLSSTTSWGTLLEAEPASVSAPLPGTRSPPGFCLHYRSGDSLETWSSGLTHQSALWCFQSWMGRTSCPRSRVQPSAHFWPQWRRPPCVRERCHTRQGTCRVQIPSASCVSQIPCPLLWMRPLTTELLDTGSCDIDFLRPYIPDILFISAPAHLQTGPTGISHGQFWMPDVEDTVPVWHRLSTVILERGCPWDRTPLARTCPSLSSFRVALQLGLCAPTR